jgi:hypothetical protein
MAGNLGRRASLRRFRFGKRVVPTGVALACVPMVLSCIPIDVVKTYHRTVTLDVRRLSPNSPTPTKIAAITAAVLSDSIPVSLSHSCNDAAQTTATVDADGTAILMIGYAKLCSPYDESTCEPNALDLLGDNFLITICGDTYSEAIRLDLREGESASGEQYSVTVISIGNPE